MGDVFEIVIDHNARDHHDQMDRAAARLRAWAARQGVRHLIKEERPIRPGVVRIRFMPDRAPRPAVGGDQLRLSGARPAHRHAPGCGCGR